MRLRPLTVALLLLYVVSAVVAQTSAPSNKPASTSRKFEFTYSFRLKNLPAGTKVVRVWFPEAHSDDHQSVALL
jgi:hypothetical protein